MPKCRFATNATEGPGVVLPDGCGRFVCKVAASSCATMSRSRSSVEAAASPDAAASPEWDEPVASSIPAFTDRTDELRAVVARHNAGPGANVPSGGGGDHEDDQRLAAELALTVGWTFGADRATDRAPYLRLHVGASTRRDFGDDDALIVHAQLGVQTGGIGAARSGALAVDAALVGTWEHGEGRDEPMPLHLMTRDTAALGMTRENGFAISQGIGWSTSEGGFTPLGAYAVKVGDVMIEHTNDSFTAWGAARGLASGRFDIGVIDDDGFTSGLFVTARHQGALATLSQVTCEGSQEHPGTDRADPRGGRLWNQTSDSLAYNRTDTALSLRSESGEEATVLWTSPHYAQDAWHRLGGWPRFEQVRSGLGVEWTSRFGTDIE